MRNDQPWKSQSDGQQKELTSTSHSLSLSCWVWRSLEGYGDKYIVPKESDELVKHIWESLVQAAYKALDVLKT